LKITFFSQDKLQQLLIADLEKHVSSFARKLKQTEVIVVFANRGSGARLQYQGIQWLQRLRRETNALAPALVFSFERLEDLASKFSILKPGTPGTRFVRLPFSFSQLESHLKELTPLTAEELADIVRWHSGLQEEYWNRLAHDSGSLLDEWSEHRKLAEQKLNEWAESIRKYAGDQLSNLRKLEEAFDRSPEEIRIAIQELEDGLCIKSTPPRLGSSENLPCAPFSRPPIGFSAIMVADDQGYVDCTIEDLRSRDYDVASPARSLEEAHSLLSYWHPQVVLADLHFPSWEEGQELLRSSLIAPSVRLVIAVSRARVKSEDLPQGVEDCCGGLDFQDAERIHRLIWRRARSECVEDHA
jgi:hypothetical protein